MNKIIVFCFLLLGGVFCFAQPVTEFKKTAWQAEELQRFPAVEATQGATADEQFFYAIGNHAIGKYRKNTGKKVGSWQGEKDGTIKHLNAGVVIDGWLYCSHSNFPEQPPASSVEIWDTRTMKHVKSHSFGNYAGSLTWIVRHQDHWIACFAHYAKAGGVGGDPALTQVVEFDDHWSRTGGWVFPRKLIERFNGYSASGGAFGPEGFLFVTGHDAKEMYVLSLPEAGPVLKWEDTIAISAEGQSFGWNPVRTNVFYSISRKNKGVIVSQVLHSSIGQH